MSRVRIPIKFKNSRLSSYLKDFSKIVIEKKMNTLDIDALQHIASFISLEDRVNFARTNSFYLETLFPHVSTADVLIKHHVHQQLEYLKKEWAFCSKEKYMWKTKKFYRFALAYAKRNRRL